MKPQSAFVALDHVDEASHPLDMDTRDPPKRRLDRDAKLAQALRDNLRRRKASPAVDPGSAPPKTTPDIED